MSIQIGDQAPDFSLVTLTSEGPEVFSLSSLIGEQNILILFVPMAFTGGCTTQFCSLTQELNTYNDLGAKVLGISGDNPFAQKEWAEKEGIELTLLSDYEHKVTEAYGVAYESFLPEKNLIMGGVPKRSAFVIDKAGVIRYAEVLEVPSDMPNMEAVKSCLKAL